MNEWRLGSEKLAVMAHILLVGFSLKQRLEVDLDFPRSRRVLVPPTFSLHLPMATNYFRPTFPQYIQSTHCVPRTTFSSRSGFRMGVSYLVRKVPHHIPEGMLTWGTGMLGEGRPSFLSAAAIKHPNTKQHREKGFISAHNSCLESIIVRKSKRPGWLELGAISYIQSTAERERMCTCLVHSWPIQGVVLPTSGWGVLTSIKAVKTIPHRHAHRPT